MKIDIEYPALFIGFAFTLNTLAGIYRKFFVFFRDYFIKLVETLSAPIQADEKVYPLNCAGLSNLVVRDFLRFGELHKTIQKHLYEFGRLFAWTGVLGCIVTVMFGLVSILGNQIAWLISPIVIYILLAFIIFLTFVIPALLISMAYALIRRRIEQAGPPLKKSEIQTLDSIVPNKLPSSSSTPNSDR